MKTKLLLLQAIRWVISLTQLNNTFTSLHGTIVIKKLELPCQIGAV